MQDNPNTENERYPLETEDWILAFAPYDGSPGAALSLGVNLMILRAYLSVMPLKISESVEALDRAMEVLFPFTEFHDLSFDLFVRFADGKLTTEEEESLRALGVKF
jgi:hypothetical protein